MYIKNISQILNLKGQTNQPLSKGSVVSAKVLSLSDNKGVVQLSNGSILPSVFLVNENIEENKTYRFFVREYNSEQIVLEILGNEANEENKSTDINRILSSLNMSKEEGEEIISKLIKFSIPAKNESILNMYNNYNFLKEIRNMSDSDLLKLIHSLSGKTLTQESKEFINLKNVLNILQNVDLDFLAFLEQNKIPATVENLLKVNDFMKNPLANNDIIQFFDKYNTEKPTLNINPNNLDNSTINNISKQLNLTPTSIKEVVNFLSSNNIDLTNLSNDDLFNITSLLLKENNNVSKEVVKSLTDTLKNLSTLSKLNTNDNSFIDNIKASLKSSIGLEFDNDTIKEVSLRLRENPTLANSIKSSNGDSNSFLKLCQSLMGNSNLTLESKEVLILKEFAKGNLDSILNIRYSKADKLESLIIKSLLPNEAIAKDTMSSKLSSMSSVLTSLKDNPELIYKLPVSLLNFTNETLDINKYINGNYTMFNFNFNANENLYKNNIIIKNKYSSKYIDVNDVKLYLSVDAPNLGLVEGYVAKKFNDISINLKAKEDHVTKLKNNIKNLEARLLNMGYNIVNISIEPYYIPSTLLNLSDFFGNEAYNNLDVRV